MSEQVNETRKVMNEYIHFFNANDVEGLAALHDAKYVSHDNGEDGDLNKFKDTLNSWFKAFPDSKMTVINTVVEGDLAVINFISTGTHLGANWPIPGQPASGAKVKMSEIRVRKIKDGKIVEEWGLLDSVAFMNGISSK